MPAGRHRENPKHLRREPIVDRLTRSAVELRNPTGRMRGVRADPAKRMERLPTPIPRLSSTTTCARGSGLVTCNPNELVAPVHPKAMITILKPEDRDRWLTCGYEEVVAMQRPYPAHHMAVRGPEFPTRTATT